MLNSRFMKNVFIVALFSLIGLSVFSKNYELIKTDGVFYYGTYSCKISHITNLSNGIMCYPVPTAEFISFGKGSINPNTSILGDSIYIASNGDTRFFNSRGFSLFFIPFDDFEPRVVYSDDLGTQITGQYTGLASEEIMPGYIGDFAILQLQVKDFSGNPLTDHALHLKELRVSKEFGYMEFFRMDEFRGIHYKYYCNPFKLRKLTALQTSTETIGKQPRFDKITTSLEIGTEIHFTHEGIFANDFFFDFFFFEIKKTVTDKVINSPYITYSFTKCVHIYDHHYDTAYTEEVTELYHYKSILNQVLDSFDISGQNGFRRATNYGTGIEESFYMPYFDYDVYYKVSEYEMDSIL